MRRERQQQSGVHLGDAPRRAFDRLEQRSKLDGLDVQFIGAAQTVAGSMNLVRTGAGSVLSDCGLFQGRRREACERNRDLRLLVMDVVAIVLSHAHINHSGALPMLVRAVNRGPIDATPATRDLATAMLQDAALIQEQDARHLNRHAEREGFDLVEPLYDEADVLRTLGMFHSVPYGLKSYLTPKIALTFRDAGHVLGSAITVLDLKAGPDPRRLAFTGDLRRRDMPI